MQERKNIYFISDLHLGVEGKDTTEAREQKAVRFLQSIENDAKRVFLLGDIFDFWFEYKKVVPKGFVRLFGQLAKMTDMGIEIDFFCGNHDLWQRDYFKKEMNIRVHKEKTKEFVFNDKVFVLGHGDRLNKKEYVYCFIRNAIFANPLCIAIFSILPPRLGLSFARLWSKYSRLSHKESDMKSLGEKESIYIFCQQYIEKRKADYFIFGHRHIIQEYKVGESSWYINTGSWLNALYYAKWDGQKLTLEKVEF
ncbi:MAG: UDP-2,3-diacylglucosamine diphosphatase [Bacteroidota bacterium]|nr:UDP-2,3-diacylglucosamine diphosphatase [Bacteroidota bacterium]